MANKDNSDLSIETRIMHAPCRPAPRKIFEDFFGSSSLTACPVTNKKNLRVDFNIGLDQAHSSDWMDVFEGIHFMQAISASSEQYIHASTEEGGGECWDCLPGRGKRLSDKIDLE
ncbi:hypothetical protein GUITHDRAFT_146425 [Guillardia theta CCMP2712]|uniref:Uncharacterized protein n=1 Tax=Guillardia theta (strain CCMP2712) TaxID=905079 RepID=L1II56_GUITC|nr:hypothetical protein GUITHDRAFT_146425 [Guillardia theta CCMP2712]EKX35500.1 hypothetical protein GUITHDRAFT_146425 [Guillardia theta CCMP2712]|eukprot:XP_005822480.1 hypothetical protein GUITHDRAFT_146425 [Guillardia theta CCMP2712]